MDCPKCKKELAGEAKFCPYCGENLTAKVKTKQEIEEQESLVKEYMRNAVESPEGRSADIMLYLVITLTLGWVKGKSEKAPIDLMKRT